MCIDTEIDNTINRLAAVFMAKNIPVIPVSELSYFDLDCEDSGLYVLELIDHLETLFGRYGVKNMIQHRKYKYYIKFKDLYEENVEDGYLLPRPIVRICV